MLVLFTTPKKDTLFGSLTFVGDQNKKTLSLVAFQSNHALIKFLLFLRITTLSTRGHTTCLIFDEFFSRFCITKCPKLKKKI